MVKKKNKKGLKGVKKGPLIKKSNPEVSSMSKEDRFWLVENAMDVLKTKRQEALLGMLLDDLETEDFME